MSNHPIVRAHIRVTGQVQGVFFRQQTQRRARAEGLAGWVRNLPDGSVQAAFEGNRAGVEALVAWSRSGPAQAQVAKCDVTWEEPQGEHFFRILP